MIKKIDVTGTKKIPVTKQAYMWAGPAASGGACANDGV
jgi:hypothetical protein